MKQKKDYRIFYVITTVIFLIVSVQIYWNIENYKINKQKIVNDIQTALDDSVEKYFSNIHKTKGIVINGNHKCIIIQQPKIDTLNQVSHLNSNLVIVVDEQKKIKPVEKNMNDTFGNITPSTIKKNHILNQKSVKQHLENYSLKDTLISNNIKIEIKRYEKYYNEKSITTFSITPNKIDFTTLDSIVKNNLQQKNIDMDFYLEHIKNKKVFETTKKKTQNFQKFASSSKSINLQKDNEIHLKYENVISETIYKGWIVMLLSILICFTVIASLFYMLKIINRQKEISQMKNDLISNITHEFKTPISVISAVIETMKNFGIINNPKKTKEYLQTTQDQTLKLNEMVESLLDTAVLDTGKLVLKKENIDIVTLIEKLISSIKTITEKQIIFNCNLNIIQHSIDVFHFKNAINNLIENSIKYGGNQIELHLYKRAKNIEISVIDNGEGIEKKDTKKIFDKFYRVSTGNIHNVKGFGIGLYYTQKIIEKHGGTIELIPNEKTIFKILIPHE